MKSVVNNFVVRAKIDTTKTFADVTARGFSGLNGSGVMRVRTLTQFGAFLWDLPDFPLNDVAIFDGPIQMPGVNYTISGKRVTVIDGNEFQNPMAIYTI